MLTDNSSLFIDWMKVCVEYSAPDSKIDIKDSLLGMRFTITPSQPEFKQDMVDNILSISRYLGQKIIFSSSLALQKNVSFLIETQPHMN